MGFSREEIRKAKEGVHWIRWYPGAPRFDEVRVSRVRGDFVWVRDGSGTELSLNGTASRDLIAGKKRAPE